MLNKKAPIGVIDSGVGGLSVLKWLKELLPAENFIYIGDTARAPYGSRTADEVQGFADQMLNYLQEQQVKLVVLACNTMTVLGVPILHERRPFRILGMSKGEKLVLAASRNKHIGVMATEFTINSEAHKKAIALLDEQALVVPKACPKFVPLIEAEHFLSIEVEEAIDEYTGAMKEQDVDTLLLACTHYPFIQKEIEVALGSDVQVIDPAEETALKAKAFLQINDLTNDSGEHGSVHVCFTQDVERAKRLATRMFDISGCVFEEINVEK